MNITPAKQRKQLIERELSAYKISAENPTYPLDFRGQRLNLPVINVNPELLLLSHKNSRVFAQLDEHPNKDFVLQNPDSSEAQAVILQLLRSTEKYSALKAELDTLGQQQPGVITREGILVNGNTRAAALIELGRPGILVAVLPANAGPSDLLDIEMTLQMTQLTHQAYSFTNRLLMMRRYMDAGHSAAQLADKMAWLRRGEAKVLQHMRLLDYVESVRGLAKSHIPYSIFDKKHEHLKNLDDDYRSLKNEGAIADAEHLKWTRLSAIVLGINKDQVRAIDVDFVDEELARRIDDSEELKEFMSQFETATAPDDGLDDILDNHQSDDPPVDMRKFLEFVVNDEGFDVSTGDLDADLPDVVAKFSEQIRIGADYLIDKKKIKDSIEAPIEALRGAKVRLMDVRDQFMDVVDHPGFKDGKFMYQLKQVKKTVDELMTLAEKARY